MGAKARWSERERCWYVKIDHNGRRQSKKIGADGKAAKKIADEINVELTRGEFRLPERKRDVLLFKTHALEWKEKYPALAKIAPNTQASYTWATDKHLCPYFGSTPVADIDYKMIEAFIAEKRGPNGSLRYKGKPLSDPVLRIALVTLRLILDRAVRDKIISVNPARGVVRLKRPADTERDRVEPFTPEELRAILRAAAAEDAAFASFVRFWVQTGARLGEVLGVQNRDLDTTKATVYIRRTWSPGRADREHYRPGPTKTRQSRIVYFTHPVTEPTSEWRPNIKDESLRILTELDRLPTRRLAPEAFVFGGDKPWPAWRVYQKWRAVLAAAKVRFRNPEQLRHTFASTLLSRQAPLLYVQEQGGWKSAAVLLRVYARWCREAMPAPPEMPTFESDEQPALDVHDVQPAPARKNRTHADASQAQVTHDARTGAFNANAQSYKANLT
jgi:integrase